MLLKATKVDGVYSQDPVEHPDAKKYNKLSYLDVLNKKLGIMDSAAISLCMDNSLDILVFNLEEENAMVKAVSGESVGTLVTEGS